MIGCMRNVAQLGVETHNISLTLYSHSKRLFNRESWVLKQYEVIDTTDFSMSVVEYRLELVWAWVFFN